MIGLAHDESGKLVPTAEPDYAAIDRLVFGVTEAESDSELPPELLGTLVKSFRAGAEWLWQDGMNNPDGLKIRAIVWCWNLHPVLRRLTMTQIARGYGMDKQSIGRW